jgi:hypothetical protein
MIPLFETQPEVNAYAIALPRGIILVSNLNVDRKGRLSARQLRATFAWTDVDTYELADGQMTVQLEPAAGGWLLAIRGNAATWPAVLRDQTR